MYHTSNCVFKIVLKALSLIIITKKVSFEYFLALLFIFTPLFTSVVSLQLKAEAVSKGTYRD